jgi:hypothetical protein
MNACAFMVFASIRHYSHSNFIHFKIHYNIISPTPSSSSWYLSFARSHQNCTYVDFHPHAFTITRPSQSSFISSPLMIFLVGTTHESHVMWVPVTAA